MSTVFLFLLLAVYFYWLKSPRLTHPTVTADLIESIEGWLSERRQATELRDVNGYLNPVFLPLWGRGRDRLVGCETERIVRDWAQYGAFHENKQHDHLRLQSCEDYLERRRGFRELLDPLTEALDMPRFLMPERSLMESSMEVTSVVFLQGGLVASAESYLTQGRVKEAFSALVLGLRLAKILGEQPDMTVGMVSARNLRVGLIAFGGLIEPSYSDSEDWRDLSQLCLSARNSEDQVIFYLQLAMWQLGQSMSANDADEPYSYLKSAIGRLVGFPGNFLRANLNECTHLILELQKYGRILPQEGSASASVLGQRQTYQRFLSSLADIYALLQGLGAASALLADYHRSGKFIVDLSELDEPRISNGMTWSHEPGVLTISRSLLKSTPRGVCPQSLFPNSWIEPTSNGYRFLLRGR